YITYEIKLLPAGCKARCDYHLYITRERFNALKEATMNASDLREEFKYSLRASDKKVTLVDMPALPFLMFDGAGDPNTSPDFQDGINALYSLTYTAKFTLKARDPALDFSIMTLDGLWSTARPEDIYEKSKLSWTLLMMQPRWMTPQLVEEMKAEVARKRPLEALARVRLETFAEGLAAQILHIGPYDSEHETVNRLTEWMAANGYEQNGRHHEIYLSDPRRVPPEKYRTIIRHPVKTITA
ncbi:MAG: GyrI-like domain-containing protein, partial [Chloroflexi bacterium]|nr:GyrI-like domain-containing protein [Chloroflexota bacterium]